MPSSSATGTTAQFDATTGYEGRVVPYRLDGLLDPDYACWKACMLVSRGLALLHPQIGLNSLFSTTLTKVCQYEKETLQGQGRRAKGRHAIHFSRTYWDQEVVDSVKSYLQGMQLGHAINCALC